MLIYHYTALIQFIAVFYFSMCFEQLIEKYFWNKKYENRLEGIIKKVEQIFKLCEEDKTEINSVFKSRQKRSLKITRMVSFVLLILSIFVLILSGIEQSLSCWQLPFVINIIILSVIVLPALFIFFNGFLKTIIYPNNVERKIEKESIKLSKVIFASVNKDTDNVEYNKFVVQKLNNISGDTVNISQISYEVIEDFKKESIANIKRHICGKNKLIATASKAYNKLKRILRRN